MDSDLVAALRYRGVAVVTALDSGLVGKPDEEQLAFATARMCVLYTFNVSDFYRLHMLWVSGGREHGGMILAAQQRFSVGEQLRRILRLRATATAESMRNQVQFLGNWGGPYAGTPQSNGPTNDLCNLGGIGITNEVAAFTSILDQGEAQYREGTVFAYRNSVPVAEAAH